MNPEPQVWRYQIGWPEKYSPASDTIPHRTLIETAVDFQGLLQLGAPPVLQGVQSVRERGSYFLGSALGNLGGLFGGAFRF